MAFEDPIEHGDGRPKLDLEGTEPNYGAFFQMHVWWHLRLDSCALGRDVLLFLITVDLIALSGES